MICKNCGNEYDDHEVVCPFCGTENELEAKRREKQDLLKAEQQEEEEELERARRKALYKKIAAIVAAVLIVLGAVVFFVYKYTTSDSAKAKKAEELATLEQYYQDEEYDKVLEYLQTCEYSYTSDYDKYITVSRIVGAAQQYNGIMEKLREQSKTENVTPTLSNALSETLSQLKTLDTYESQGFVHGEEAAVRYYQKMDRHELLDVAMLSEEELEYELAVSSMGRDYTELSTKVISRWKEADQ